MREKKYTGSKQERNRQAAATFYQRNKEKVSKKVFANRYGISIEEYENLILSHCGKCAVCKKTDKLFVDHDHKSGKVRGLLCRKCNTGLGYFRDDVEILKSAIKFLRKNT